MAFQECFSHLRRKRHHKTLIRVRQVHRQKVLLLLHSGHHHQRLAEVRPRLARRMRQRDEHLPLIAAPPYGRNPSQSCSRRRIHALLLAAQRCAWPCAVALQAASYRLPEWRRSSPATAPLRPLHCPLPLVAGRHRVAQHLPDRLTRNPKLACYRSLTPALYKYRSPNPSI